MLLIKKHDKPSPSQKKYDHGKNKLISSKSIWSWKKTIEINGSTRVDSSWILIKAKDNALGHGKTAQQYHKLDPSLLQK